MNELLSTTQICRMFSKLMKDPSSLKRSEDAFLLTPECRSDSLEPDVLGLKCDQTPHQKLPERLVNYSMYREGHVMVTVSVNGKTASGSL